MEAIERLIKAGVLSFNKTVSVLHKAEKKETQKKKLSQQQIEQIKRYLALAERKQKMTHLLIEGDLLEEATAPLRESVEMSLRAFSYFTEVHGEHDEEKQINFSASQKELLLQKIMANQPELPHETNLLFSQLFENSIQQTDLPSLHAMHQKIIKNITRCFTALI